MVINTSAGNRLASHAVIISQPQRSEARYTFFARKGMSSDRYVAEAEQQEPAREAIHIIKFCFHAINGRIGGVVYKQIPERINGCVRINSALGPVAGSQTGILASCSAGIIRKIIIKPSNAAPPRTGLCYAALVLLRVHPWQMRQQHCE